MSNTSNNKSSDLLQQKINEFNKKNNEKNTKNFSFNIYNICTTAALLVAASALGFVGGTIASKIPNSQTPAVSSNEKFNSQDSYENTDGQSSAGTYVLNSSITAIAQRSIKSIAEINTETAKTDKSLKQYTSSGAGSGIVVSSDGYILTNNHVISGATRISATVDGEHFDATLVGSDSEMDIALIKVDKSGLQPVVFGDSSNIKIGENVVVIGNPLGQLGGTVTEGIISALNRDITINNETLSLIQTDAAVNPGNSGGGLFDLRGELIGMVTAKSKSATYEGIGFAIPVNNLKKPLSDLREFGYVRGRAGIDMGITDASMMKSSSLYKNYTKGVFITNVPDDSNAKAAGLQVGDCIVSIDSTEVSDITSLNKLIKNYSAGDTVSVNILRKEESLSLNLQLTEKK